MKKVDLIVTAPHIYTMKGEGVGYEEKKALVVDGSKIIDIVDIDSITLRDPDDTCNQCNTDYSKYQPRFVCHDSSLRFSSQYSTDRAQYATMWT